MLAAFLPLVLACDVFLLGTATSDTSLYTYTLLLLIYSLSHRQIIFTELLVVNAFALVIFHKIVHLPILFEIYYGFSLSFMLNY